MDEKVMTMIGGLEKVAPHIWASAVRGEVVGGVVALALSAVFATAAGWVFRARNGDHVDSIDRPLMAMASAALFVIACGLFSTGLTSVTSPEAKAARYLIHG